MSLIYLCFIRQIRVQQPFLCLCIDVGDPGVLLDMNIPED